MKAPGETGNLGPLSQTTFLKIPTFASVVLWLLGATRRRVNLRWGSVAWQAILSLGFRAPLALVLGGAGGSSFSR